MKIATSLFVLSAVIAIAYSTPVPQDSEHFTVFSRNRPILNALLNTVAVANDGLMGITNTYLKLVKIAAEGTTKSIQSVTDSMTAGIKRLMNTNTQTFNRI